MKKFVSIILAAVILILPLAVGIDGLVLKSEASDINFKCGDNATWYLDTKTGVLTISGTGKTYSYVTETAPWKAYASYITSVKISEGITVLEEGTLNTLTKVVSLSLPSSLIKISTSATLVSLETILIPEDGNLRCVYYSQFASESIWYANQPDNSPIYIGPLLFGYKGDAPENTSIEVKDGTKAINRKAFKDIANVTDITFPNTLNYIGEYAFEGTGWYDDQPDGAVYAGSVLLSYKGTMTLEEVDFAIKDGVKGIADRAFEDNEIINSLIIPSSVEIIGNQAFKSCKNMNSVTIEDGSVLHEIMDSAFLDVSISQIDFPESLEIIGYMSFHDSSLKEIYIPANVKMLDGAFSAVSASKFEVSEDNPYYCSDSDGVLFSKDKTVLHYVPALINKTEYVVPSGVLYIENYAFSFSRLDKITFNDELQSTGGFVFYRSYADTIDLGKGIPVLNTNMFRDNWGTSRLTIPENIKTIENGSLGFHLEQVYFTSKNVVFERPWYNSQTPTFYCYPDSTAYTYAVENELLYVLYSDDNIGDYTELEYAVKLAKSVSSSRQTTQSYSSSYSQMISVLENIPWNIDADYQSEIDDMTENLNTLFTNMKIVWVDYSAVDEAIENANSIDRSLYTSESLAVLDEAINSVVRYCDVADEVLINEYVTSINNAAAALDEKSGDYSEMTEAIKSAANIDRSLYTDESLKLLDETVSEAENAPKTDNQSIINSYTSAINNALNSLKYKPADFYEINAVLDTVKSLNRTLYTSESLALLDEALAAVDYELTIDKQSQVSEWAAAIESAIDNLEYLPADYSAVEAEIEEADALDRRYYSELSLIALDTAINAVDYTLKITEQDKVNGYAQAIAKALASLEYASIVLRHEPCGVIVSATTKEIKPDTVLAVEEIDPSNYEGTNFAVGGSIRSLHFYDINLVYEAVVVQPDGTVTVKIKLADGVDPAKCKVYHVTEDIVNPLVRYASTIDGNYIVFETDHFSEFAVIEVETVLDSIEIAELPETTVYGIGEQLDTTGIRVIAHFSDGTNKEIDGYNVGMVKLSSVGTKKVTVYYTFGSITKTAEFEITVSASKCTADIKENGKSVNSVNKKIGLFSFYSKASIQLDCDVKNADGCTVRWLSDNPKVFVDENGKVTCKGFFSTKKANITVEVVDSDGNVVARDTVSVVFYKFSFQLSNTMSQAVDVLKRNIVLW